MEENKKYIFSKSEIYSRIRQHNREEKLINHLKWSFFTGTVIWILLFGFFKLMGIM
jgi:hypothetical protein